MSSESTAPVVHPSNDTVTKPKYPVIDKDPHFFRVLKFFRAEDYAAWSGMTLLAPGLMHFMEYIDPTHAPGGSKVPLRMGWIGGFCGGFLLAYQRTSYRFFGFRENVREVALAKKEWADSKLPGGKLPWGYGPSDLSPWLQGVAFRNSAYSATMFGWLPWFNFINHPYHFPDEGLEG